MLRHPMIPRSSLRLLTLVRRCLVSSSLAMMGVATASAQGTRFLRRPAVSRELVAFEYGGDLWVVPRTGGEARRLTSTPSEESDPYFSPDGSQIAFSATISGVAISVIGLAWPKRFPAEVKRAYDLNAGSRECYAFGHVAGPRSASVRCTRQLGLD